ncbi:uncharacterized protein Z518_07723 [Rhinocladiella mackenziei CBS 650.93]|uniref:Rhinocladiella mackenziei CBS 650.93 unplaced genomic scaffold supercont1.5, whole genome shotgun sequence n=1 Tax=Rhinocladiella mackenziei CBS 650.93 TaxID=1442369 RepID=A0A0D2IEB3_9EURO|nr:uncharacterized protein Z518_07723 [Rhinocladiella mackenziei CBS 650.93]KIX04169.1 hypothetical protein Z518_07723 [Rhinocladiella mackenziei CBS 650.93]
MEKPHNNGLDMKRYKAMFEAAKEDVDQHYGSTTLTPCIEFTMQTEQTDVDVQGEHSEDPTHFVKYNGTSSHGPRFCCTMTYYTCGKTIQARRSDLPAIGRGDFGSGLMQVVAKISIHTDEEMDMDMDMSSKMAGSKRRHRRDGTGTPTAERHGQPQSLPQHPP